MNLFPTPSKVFNASGFYVYAGYDSGILVYIGTTIQVPADRFRWHKANGKDLNFTVLHSCANADEMLDKEWELIKKLKPRLNNITKRKQNLNKKLDDATTQQRIGDKEWCQSCFRRRVNVGYTKCYYCSK